MSQKSSLMKTPQCVPRALTSDIRVIISQAEALAALEGRLKSLEPDIANGSADQAMKAVKSAAAALGAVDGISQIRSKLSKARRALRGDSPKRDKAAGQLAEALELLATEVAWRRQAAAQLAGGLATYDEAIKSTIGLRSQERLTSEEAEEVATCQSVHRDISLSF